MGDERPRIRTTIVIRPGDPVPPGARFLCEGKRVVCGKPYYTTEGFWPFSADYKVTPRHYETTLIYEVDSDAD